MKPILAALNAPAATGVWAAVCLLAAVPTAAQAPAQSNFHLSLAYDGRLLVKVLDIQVEQTAQASGFSSSVHLKSYGVLAAFKHFDVRASAQGRIAHGLARPGTFHHQNLDGKSNRKTDVVWTGGDVTAVFAPPVKGPLGQPPASRAQKLGAADPLTGLMRMALGGGEGGVCRGTLKVFDGKQRYDLDFSGRAPGRVTAREAKLGLVNPVHCALKYREVAGYRKRPAGQQNQGMKRPIVVGIAQVGAGGPWVISFLDAQTPLGHAVIELERIRR